MSRGNAELFWGLNVRHHFLALGPLWGRVLVNELSKRPREHSFHSPERVSLSVSLLQVWQLSGEVVPLRGCDHLFSQLHPTKSTIYFSGCVQNRSSWAFCLYLGCFDNLFCQLVHHRGSVHCSLLYCLTPSLSPEPWVFWMSHIAKQFKPSTSAAFFAQPLLSAESSYCCFHDFPPCISREALTNLLVQIE